MNVSHETDTPVQFTREMKETHTILIPTMLPIHFNFMASILNQYGYHTEVLSNTGSSVVNEGLRSVHNDICYPALLVIGQMIDALRSGRYDINRVALLITQTGGGCRASNYIHLLRKALKKSGFGHVPVISLSMQGLEKNEGFKITLPMALKMIYAVILGDLLMLLSNQCLPYEAVKGDTQRMVERWEDRILQDFGSRLVIRDRMVRGYYREMIEDFASIPKTGEKKVRVGIVGEIYVKYSPLGNNNLEAFLLEEGAEPVVPGLLDFAMYCVYNGIVDKKLYGGSNFSGTAYRLAYKILLSKQRAVIRAIEQQGSFRPPTSFEETHAGVLPYISDAVKMGEGWLLTAEMIELINQGVNNIVCTQPFGCLPNHIVGKGMMRMIKEKNPKANIVAVDYDPGASEVNQQNRIKLMLANAAMEQDG